MKSAQYSSGFTAYMRSQLKAKYPDLYFDDIDHYAGSVVVEATVSTSSGTKSGTLVPPPPHQRSVPTKVASPPPPEHPQQTLDLLLTMIVLNRSPSRYTAGSFEDS